MYDSEGNIHVSSSPQKVEDAVYLGTSVPVYSGAVNTNLRYKNWELAAQLLFEGGHKMRNTNIAYPGLGVTSKDVSKRWRQLVMRHIPMYHAMFRQKARIIILTHPIFIARLPFMYLMPITGA